MQTSGASLSDACLQTKSEWLELRDGARLGIITWQSAANRTSPCLILILHGLGGHSGYYDYFASRLSEAGPLVCGFDRRGHGKSDGPRGDIKHLGTDALDLAEVLVWLRSTYPNKNIFLLGDSWGCLCGQYFLAKTSATVAGVILASPPVRLTVRRSWIKPSLRLTGEIFANFIRLRFNGRIGPPFPLSLASRDPRFFAKLRNDPYTDLKMTTRYGIVALFFLLNAKRYARKVGIPTLILQGDGDRLLNPNGARKLFQVIPAADKELILIADAEHTLYYDPETPYVIETILKWIADRNSS